MSCEAAVIINRRDFDATIFDLDGVLTDTARVHAAAWGHFWAIARYLWRHLRPRKLTFSARNAPFLVSVHHRPGDARGLVG
jgi:beta-phosphoglucomutase-like phosphatase (HAD superfamily)